MEKSVESEIIDPVTTTEIVHPVTTTEYVTIKRFGFGGTRYEIGDTVPKTFNEGTIKKLLLRNLIK